MASKPKSTNPVGLPYPIFRSWIPDEEKRNSTVGHIVAIQSLASRIAFRTLQKKAATLVRETPR